MTPTKTPIKAILIALLVICLLWLVYFLRPLAIFHGPLWVLLKYEVFWVWPTVFATIAAVGAALVSSRSKGDSGPFVAGTFFVVGLVSFFILAFLTPHMMKQATFKHYSYTLISQLPDGGTVRIVPQEVAQGISESSYQTSGHTLKSAHIILDPRTQQLTWTFEQAPTGFVNTYFHNTVGVAQLSAEQTERTYREIDRKFKFGPSMKISDSVNWQFRERHYFGVPTDPIAVVTKQGEPVFVMPWLTYKHSGSFWLTKYPAVGGVMVFHADGRIEDLSRSEAAKRGEITATGRIIPEGLAREIQDAYAYKSGIANVLFTHNDQTSIQDDPQTDNHMPYLMSFEKNGKQILDWVSVAEPKGKTYAANTIFFTNAITGNTDVWRAPKNKNGTREALTGPNRAIQLAKSRAIPGIIYASTAGEQGKFTVVEPRPVFIKGHLRFLLSVIPSYQPQAVTKSVIVDAEKSKVIAVFNHDTDPNADSKLIHYLKTGELDQSAVVAGGKPSSAGKTPSGSTPTGTVPASAGTTAAQIQVALDQNKKLQAELKQQQAQLEGALKKSQSGK